jgi:hypothetical protein
MLLCVVGHTPSHERTRRRICPSGVRARNSATVVPGGAPSETREPGPAPKKSCCEAENRRQRRTYGLPPQAYSCCPGQPLNRLRTVNGGRRVVALTMPKRPDDLVRTRSMAIKTTPTVQLSGGIMISIDSNCCPVSHLYTLAVVSLIPASCDDDTCSGHGSAALLTRRGRAH